MGILVAFDYVPVKQPIKIKVVIIKFYNRVQMIKQLLKQMFRVIHYKMNRKWTVASVDKFYDKM